MRKRSQTFLCHQNTFPMGDAVLFYFFMIMVFLLLFYQDSVDARVYVKKTCLSGAVSKYRVRKSKTKLTLFVPVVM